MDSFHCYFIHFHRCKVEQIPLLVDYHSKIWDDVLELSYEECTHQVVYYCVLAREYDMGDSFHYRLLQHKVIQAEALSVEETCDLLALL